MANEIQIAKKFKPLFQLLNDNVHPEVDTIILTGGRGCFVGNQLIETENGLKEISKVSKGDKVYSMSENGVKELKNVNDTFKYSNDKLIEINLKNGSKIKVTENHKFYHKGGWVSIKDLLSLWYGNMEKDT